MTKRKTKRKLTACEPLPFGENSLAFLARFRRDAREAGWDKDFIAETLERAQQRPYLLMCAFLAGFYKEDGIWPDG